MGLMVVMLFGLAAWLHDDEGPPPCPSLSPEEPYQRKDWRHWTDADRDCQDTRQEVLIAESEIEVGWKKHKKNRRCKVARGRWRCPYTGKVITNPRYLDVDHLVPLAEAHRSGGHAWDSEQRKRYANALEDPGHLVAVDRGSNRAKGDKGPDAWMPPNPAFRCEYLQKWQAIKERWSLEMDGRERAYIEQAQSACNRGEIPPLPERQRD